MLAPEERWSMSENPVRSDRLILNFSEPADVVRIYSLTGTPVRTLVPDASASRIEWRLDNDDGALVASGVYLLLIQFGDARVTRKLMVLRSR